MVQCRDCKGKGYILVENPTTGITARITCATCGGSGQVPDAK